MYLYTILRKPQKDMSFVGQEESGGITEFESRDVTFLDDTFPRQGEISQDLSLFEIFGSRWVD